MSHQKHQEHKTGEQCIFAHLSNPSLLRVLVANLYSFREAQKLAHWQTAAHSDRAAAIDATSPIESLRHTIPIAVASTGPDNTVIPVASAAS